MLILLAEHIIQLDKLGWNIVINIIRMEQLIAVE